MGLVFIILVGIIIALVRSNNNLSDEIYNLKRILSRVDNFCPNCGFALNKNHNISNCNVNYNIQNNHAFKSFFQKDCQICCRILVCGGSGGLSGR